jgi:hypothetical protein
VNWDVSILKAKNWKLKSLCEASGIWNFEIEMSEFGWVNSKSRKLKTENWNLFGKCPEGIWNFENWKMKIEISEYSKLKTKMSKY